MVVHNEKYTEARSTDNKLVVGREGRGGGERGLLK